MQAAVVREKFRFSLRHKMSKKTKYIIAFSILILVLGLFGIFGWQFYIKQQVNYLIPGVPYYGFYNRYFEANNNVVTTSASVLEYWGDNRFSLADLTKRFFTGSKTDYLFSDIRNFFEENGYKTYYRVLSGAENQEETITQLKEFVNPEKKIPVIVLQQKFLDPSAINGYRLVIGVFDKDKKIITHDYNFGNNYEISYENFDKMFNPHGRAILAVWPSENLLPKLKGPDYTKPYPKRLSVMDSVGEMLAKVSTAVFFYNGKNYEKALPIYQEFVNDPKFNDFPPAHRVSFYTSLANIYRSLNNPDKAIEIINSQVLPLNNNLNQPYNGLTEQVEFFKANNYTESKLETPYYSLGMAYLLKGNKELARKNFEEALKINPDNTKARDALKNLK